MKPDTTVGILLTNVGSPEAPTTPAVRRYLRQFLSDPMVVDAPRLRWLLILNLVVLPRRAPRSARLYRSIWTADGSPLVATTRRQAAELERALENRHGLRIPVVAAMRYGRPSLDHSLSQLQSLGCSRVLVLPLFPQYSRTTVGTTSVAVDRIIRRRPNSPQTRLVEGYAEDPGYIAALAASITEARGDVENPSPLIMSFHGLPKRFADAGDPYPDECRATAEAVAERLRLKPSQWQLCYQSKFGREEWLGPATDETLARLGSAGTAGVDVVCPGFAADCLETVEEIAVTNRKLYEDAGGRGFRYIAALNERPDHIQALADLAASHLGSWEGSDAPPRSFH